MTKARDIADFKFEDIVDTGTEGTKVASGTTAQRGSTAGQFRFNSTNNLAEYYDGTQFKSIDSPPTVSSISPTTETDANSNIVITGSNFSSGATVKFIGNDGTEYASPSVTVNSTTQITATTPASALTVANEPYDVQVTNASGLSGVLADALDAGGSPTWSTASGNIGTVIEDEAVSSLSISATDPDGQSVSITSSDFSIAGLTLATNGAITGTPNVNDSYNSNGVTHSFNAVASDGVNTTSRAFNILRKWPDGSSSSTPAVSAVAIKSLTGTTTNGYYYLKTPSDNVVRQWWCDMNTDGGGWVLIARSSGSISSSANNWYSSNNAGGFNTSSSGQYTGGGYWNNGSQSKILWEMSAGGSTTRKLRLNWGTGNFNTLPSTTHSSFVTGVSNDGGVRSSSFPNISIKGQNNFTTQFLVTWSFRGISGYGENGPYFYFGQQYNGSHQHYEETITGNDSDGTGRFIYAVNFRNAISQQTVESSTSGFVNIWCKP